MDQGSAGDVDQPNGCAVGGRKGVRRKAAVPERLLGQEGRPPVAKCAVMSRSANVASDCSPHRGVAQRNCQEHPARGKSKSAQQVPTVTPASPTAAFHPPEVLSG